MIQRRTPLKRSALPARTKRPNAKRAKPRRVSVLRDREYLDWLKERSCVACRKYPGQKRWSNDFEYPKFLFIDPAHGPANGRGSKGPDNEALPLCRHHHDEQHRIGWLAVEAKYGFKRRAEAKAHWAAFLLTGEAA